MQDFHNSLEIALYKLNTMTGEIRMKEESCSILEICENVFSRQIETAFCLQSIERTDHKCR